MHIVLILLYVCMNGVLAYFLLGIVITTPDSILIIIACVTYFMHVRTGFRNSRLRHLDRFAGVYMYSIKLPFSSINCPLHLLVSKTTIVHSIIRFSKDNLFTTCLLALLKFYLEPSMAIKSAAYVQVRQVVCIRNHQYQVYVISTTSRLYIGLIGSAFACVFNYCIYFHSCSTCK